MMLWNVTYKLGDENVFIEAMNNLRPDDFRNKRREWKSDHMRNELTTTMVEMTEEEALIMSLTVQLKIERLK